MTNNDSININSDGINKNTIDITTKRDPYTENLFRNKLDNIVQELDFSTQDIQDKINAFINYILPSKSCTRVNLILGLFGLVANKPYISSVCYSNSLAILVSFQSASIFAPESYSNLVKLYKSSVKFWFLNIISHYLPVLVFYKLTNKNDITLKSVSTSCMIHFLWGKSVNWDVNNIYKIKPPLNNSQQNKLWFMALLTHYMIYFVPRKIYPFVLPMILPIGKHSIIKRLLPKRLL